MRCQIMLGHRAGRSRWQIVLAHRAGEGRKWGPVVSLMPRLAAPPVAAILDFDDLGRGFGLRLGQKLTEWPVLTMLCRG